MSIRDIKCPVFENKFMSEKWPIQPDSQLNNLERKSGVVKVVNGSEEEKQKVLNYFEDIFKNQEKSPYEREKTEDENKIINIVNNEISKIVKGFGGMPVEITQNNIHLLVRSSMPDKLQKKYEGKLGFFSRKAQGGLAYFLSYPRTKPALLRHWYTNYYILILFNR